jgi:toxin YoeB
MRSISFEGNTWQVYEELRTQNKTLHNSLCKLLKEMQRK